MLTMTVLLHVASRLSIVVLVVLVPLMGVVLLDVVLPGVELLDVVLTVVVLMGGVVGLR